MQFQSIIAVLSFALVATAMPTTPSGPTTVNTGNQVCKANQTAAKCKISPSEAASGTIVVTLLGNLLGGGILNCSPISLIPIASGNQQVANACCDTKGNQNGLINVGTVCVPIQA